MLASVAAGGHGSGLGGGRAHRGGSGAASGAPAGGGQRQLEAPAREGQQEEYGLAQVLLPRGQLLPRMSARHRRRPGLPAPTLLIAHCFPRRARIPPPLLIAHCTPHAHAEHSHPLRSHSPPAPAPTSIPLLQAHLKLHTLCKTSEQLVRAHSIKHFELNVHYINFHSEFDKFVVEISGRNSHVRVFISRLSAQVLNSVHKCT